MAVVLCDKFNDGGNKLYDLWLEHKLPRELWTIIEGRADMGWQQKGSGRKRNIQSGHAFVIAGQTRGMIAKSFCSKGCAFCKSWRTRHNVDVDPSEHDCFQNYEGPSGSMEPKAVLDMYACLYSQHVVVGRFIADDDSSIKAKLKWSNADYMVNNTTTD